MSGWRLARSLEVLDAEIDAVAPGRGTASDGFIGDEAHQDEDSDHNPNDEDVVCAGDWTHDPAHGADMHIISRIIVDTRPPSLKYVIWDEEIWSVARASEGWRPHSGHKRHMHISVGRGPDGHSSGPYDDRSPWGVVEVLGMSVMDLVGLERNDTGPRVKFLQIKLKLAGFDPGAKDGEFGPATQRQVLRCAKAMGSDTNTGSVVNEWIAAYIDQAVAVAAARSALQSHLEQAHR